jgi:hypothetical protein
MVGVVGDTVRSTALAFCQWVWDVCWVCTGRVVRDRPSGHVLPLAPQGPGTGGTWEIGGLMYTHGRVGFLFEPRITPRRKGPGRGRSLAPSAAGPSPPGGKKARPADPGHSRIVADSSRDNASGIEARDWVRRPGGFRWANVTTPERAGRWPRLWWWRGGTAWAWHGTASRRESGSSRWWSGRRLVGQRHARGPHDHGD